MLALCLVVPLVPVVCVWDGIVSCLRTREFEEVVGLLEDGEAEREGLVGRIEKVVDEEGTAVKRVEVDGWRLEGGRVRHTWPLGWANYVIGVKMSSLSGESGSNVGGG